MITFNPSLGNNTSFKGWETLTMAEKRALVEKRNKEIDLLKQQLEKQDAASWKIVAFAKSRGSEHLLEHRKLKPFVSEVDKKSAQIYKDTYEVRSILTEYFNRVSYKPAGSKSILKTVVRGQADRVEKTLIRFSSFRLEQVFTKLGKFFKKASVSSLHAR